MLSESRFLVGSVIQRRAPVADRRTRSRLSPMSRFERERCRPLSRCHTLVEPIMLILHCINIPSPKSQRLRH
jgi:hypothetical protein